jgi:predicted metalloenzyme YecM
MLQSLETFYTEATPLAQRFDSFAKKHQLIGRAKADHICYKCDSAESFEHARALFEPAIGYLYQAKISGRRIALIRLPHPIETVLGPIHFLELSDQKPDGSQREGFDHIEAYPTDRSYEDFIKQFEATENVVKVVRPHHTTHDIDIGDGFLFRCTEGPLVEKIKAEMS